MPLALALFLTILGILFILAVQKHGFGSAVVSFTTIILTAVVFIAIVN